MKRIFVFTACVATLALASCSNEQRLPDPTGKGEIRAINAIPNSPTISFKIEERNLEGVAYKASSTPARYDDFEYNFNFDINDPTADDEQRIASIATKIDADRSYAFVLTGDLNNPTVTTWTSDVRSWEDSETVFEGRIAHLSVSLGDVDVYLDDVANPTVPGNLVASLSYGEIMDPAELEGGTYVLTVTAAGDPAVVHFSSNDITFTARTSYLMSIFDGNENDTSPYIVSAMTDLGQPIRIADSSYLSTVRVIHAARTLQNVDVYDDELLTNRIATDLAIGATTGDLLLPEDGATYYFTPVNSIATTLFSQDLLLTSLSRPAELYLVGDTDAWDGAILIQDRSAASNATKLTVFHAALNHPIVDIYIKPRDEAIDELDRPDVFNLSYVNSTPSLSLAGGSFDLYLTASGTKDVVAGPYALDVVNGDAIFLVAIDAVDPAVAEIRDVSPP